MANLLVCDKGIGLSYNIYIYSLPLTVPTTPTTTQTYDATATGNPEAGCQDAAGNSYFLLNSAGSSAEFGVLKISAGGVQSFYVTLLGLAAQDPTLGDGASIAVDAAGNVYVLTTDGSGQVWKYTPVGVKTVFATSADIGFGLALAFDHAGNLIVAGSPGAQSTLVQISPSGVATTLNGNISAAGGSNICFDATGNIYVIAPNGFFGSQVAQFDPSGVELNPAFIDMTSGVFASYPEYWLAYDPGSNTFFVSTFTNAFGAFCMAFDSSGTVLSPASLIGSKPGPYNVTATTNKLKLAMDGGAPVTITLTTGAARTAAQVVSEINTAMGAAVASAVAGKINIASSTPGNASEINFQTIANAAKGLLGLSYPPVPGGNISTPNLTGPAQFFFNGVGSLALAGPGPPPVTPTAGTGQPFSGSFVGFFGPGNFGGGTK